MTPAARALRDSAFAIAVATRPVNFSRRCPTSAGSRFLGRHADRAPHAAIDDDRARNRVRGSQAACDRANRRGDLCPIDLVLTGRPPRFEGPPSRPSNRRARSVIRPPTPHRPLPHRRRTLVASGSYRPTTAMSESNNGPTSSLTDAKISAGCTACATSTAPRCSAAYSSTRRSSSVRASAVWRKLNLRPPGGCRHCPTSRSSRRARDRIMRGSDRNIRSTRQQAGPNL